MIDLDFSQTIGVPDVPALREVHQPLEAPRRHLKMVAQEQSFAPMDMIVGHRHRTLVYSAFARTSPANYAGVATALATTILSGRFA